MQGSLVRSPFFGGPIRKIFERFTGQDSSGSLISGQPGKAQQLPLELLRHELRTPLTGILGMSELLRGSGLNREQRLLLLALEESALQMNHLVGDLGMSGSSPAFGATPRVQSFEGLSFMERIVRAHWPAARDKGIDLHLLIDRQLPANWVTDPRCLRQVLDNLLANAVKFTQHGHVMLEARRSGEAGVGPCGLELRVTDTGSGIAPGDKGRIYALHEQGNQQAGCEFGGSGLGLAICSHLARRLGASLGHEPCSGGGVRFTLSLPLAGRSIDELPLRFQPKLLKSQRCLIALKDPANSVALNLLDRMGIETECARYWQPRDGAASFDAVFCDSVQAVEWGWKMQGGSKSCRPLLLWRERAEDSLTPGESCEFKWLELPQPMLHSNLEPLMLQLALQRKLQQPDPQ